MEITPATNAMAMPGSPTPGILVLSLTSNVGALTRRTLLIRRAPLALAIGIATAVLGNLLLTPVTGDVLLLLTARQADHIVATSVDLRAAQGWMTRGAMPARAVRKAPETGGAFLVGGGGGR